MKNYWTVGWNHSYSVHHSAVYLPAQKAGWRGEAAGDRAAQVCSDSKMHGPRARIEVTKGGCRFRTLPHGAPKCDGKDSAAGESTDDQAMYRFMRQRISSYAKITQKARAKNVTLPVSIAW